MRTIERNLPASLLWGTHVVGLGVTVAALVAGYFFVHRPTASQCRDCIAAAGRIEELIAASDSITERRQDLATQHEGLKQRIEIARRRIPREASDAAFLSDVIQIAKDEQLRIVDYQPGIERTMPTHSEVEIALRCLGDYESICGFLHRMERMPRQFAVKQMAVHTKDGHDVYPFEITLILYYGLNDGAMQTHEVRS